MVRRLVSILTLFASLFVATAAMAGSKVALVIGNSACNAAPYLKNPVNDAKVVGEALTQAGFEVTSYTDLGYSALVEALGKFSRSAGTAETAVIYYAGHGMEIDRQNFLIPVDAKLEFATDAEFQAVRLDLMVRAVGGADRLGIVIVDACRNNPFATRLDQAGRDRGISQGMGRVEPRGNTLVAYSAREGTVAFDGVDDNSPYALALAKSLDTPGLEIGKLFRTVRDDVMAATGGAQEPVLFGTLSAEDYFFIPADGTVASEAPALAPVTTPAEAAVALQLELAFWDAAEKSGSAVEYALYLDRYPTGVFSSLARVRLDRFKVVPDAGAQVAEAAPVPALRSGARDEAASVDEPAAAPARAAQPQEKTAREPNAGSEKDPVLPASGPAPSPRVQTSLVPVTAPPKVAAAAEGPVPPAKVPVRISELQAQLNRLGCKVGNEDGIWGPASRDGLERLRTATQKLDGVPGEPGIELLTALKGIDEAICPPACGADEVIFNGLCVAGPQCPAGQRMSSKGTCYVPSPAAASRPAVKAAPARKPSPPAHGGSGCRIFNGKQVC